LTAHDCIAVLAWPDIGPIRWPVFATTARATSIDAVARRLWLRRRVVAIASHEVSLDPESQRPADHPTPPELLSALHLTNERDCERIEDALLEIAHLVLFLISDDAFVNRAAIVGDGVG